MLITVKDIPPSYNNFLGNSRNFNIYRQEKEKWHWLIKTAIKEKPVKPYKHAVVDICYYFKSMTRRDPDNYSGKFLLDPLVSEGIIEDDSFQNVILRLSGGYDKENPRTEIRVLEVRKDVFSDEKDI